MKNIFIVFVLLLVLCIYQSKAAVAYGFISTPNNSGDKCIACVHNSLYFCKNPSTNVVDCYDDVTDCTYVPVMSSMVPWRTSSWNCTTKPSVALSCSTVVEIAEINQGSTSNFTVTLERNQVCAIILQNSLKFG
jgi:hypothetical protein